MGGHGPDVAIVVSEAVGEQSVGVAVLEGSSVGVRHGRAPWVKKVAFFMKVGCLII